MRRTLITSGLLALGALVLAACSTGPGPVYPDRALLQIGGESSPVHTGSLALGQTDFYSLENRSSTGDYDLVIIELDDDLTLELTNRSGATIHALSEGPGSFGAADLGTAGSVAASHAPKAIYPAGIAVDAPPCRGSCFVLPPRNELLHFQVSGAVLPTEYSIYTYAAEYSDANEPFNDHMGTPAAYLLGSDDGGATETIGDRDWWRVAVSDPLTDPHEGTIEFFSGNDDLDLRLYLYRDGEEQGRYASGDAVEIRRNDLLLVRSENGRAARGAFGYYYFEPVQLLGPGMGGGQ